MKGLVSHHQQNRKRKGLEPYPSNKSLVRLVDNVAIGAGILGPAMTLPQIFEIYYVGNASGVSALSWAAFGVLDIPWIIYGVIHKNTLIRITYILWFIANIAVALGAVLYS